VTGVSPRAPRILVNTHHHPDHTYGNGFLPDSTTIVGHHLCREGVIRAQLKATEELIADYGDLVVRPPDLTIDSDITLHLDEFPIELKIMGPAHSTNDVGVWLPEQRVMFAGDLAFSGGHPIFLEGSLAGFRAAATHMRSLEPVALLPGHGPACRGDEVGGVLDDLIGYVDWIADLARTSYAAGLTPLEAALKAAGGPYADWPEGERVVCNLHRAYVELFPDYEAPGPLIIPALWPEMLSRLRAVHVPHRVARMSAVLLVAGLLQTAAPSPALAPAAGAPRSAAHGCAARGGGGAVHKPKRVRNIPTGETGWFSSPSLVDLDGDGKLEIVAPFYSTFVFDARGRLLGKGRSSKGRVYAPSVVTDLEGDGIPDIVVGGNEGTVAAYEFRGRLRRKKGWPASTTSGGQAPEVRGLAAGDLDGNGRVEIVATTTNTSAKGAQVFVFNARGKRFRPGGRAHAWPRSRGYGAYGENVAIGNIDDDPRLEIITTFDNHQIHAFNHDGSSVLASPWFKDRESGSGGRRMAWGDFIRWASPKVERRHYHLHQGAWPSPAKQPWLQWTASPPAVADLDGDGRNEVIGLPNVEKHIPYRTQGYAFMVLDGAYGKGNRSARRHPGFKHLLVSNRPVHRPDGDWYPPTGIPAPTLVDLTGDGRPEIVAALPGGRVYAVRPGGRKLWTRTYAPKDAKTFASEVVAADLNKDGTPELVFGTYALHRNAGKLVVLSAKGKKLSTARLRHQHRDGNGVGVPAAPSIADLTGNGTLEIVLTTFDHGIDVYTVPGSDSGCLPWPTGRGNTLRNGTGPSTAP